MLEKKSNVRFANIWGICKDYAMILFLEKGNGAYSCVLERQFMEFDW